MATMLPDWAKRFVAMARDAACGGAGALSFACIASNVFELRAGFLNDRRNLGHLFVRQPKLPLQPVFHRSSDKTVRMRREHEPISDRCRYEQTGGTAGHENHQKASNQFPFQRAIHCATSS